ncbi:Rrp4 [Phytophthora palmivora]|uniref:Rrp4 n=1 Tax=Phytophthora palmivora TaxID=4796 RepID=A0A2P4X1S2_9STRA|nr:Rrp4 [Phytophthora palmivora]
MEGIAVGIIYMPTNACEIWLGVPFICTCSSSAFLSLTATKQFKSITLDRREEYDGALLMLKNIPIDLQQPIAETLHANVPLRLMLEPHGKQGIHAKSLDQDDWIDCSTCSSIDFFSSRHFP